MQAPDAPVDLVQQVYRVPYQVRGHLPLPPQTEHETPLGPSLDEETKTEHGTENGLERSEQVSDHLGYWSDKNAH